MKPDRIQLDYVVPGKPWTEGAKVPNVTIVVSCNAAGVPIWVQIRNEGDKSWSDPVTVDGLLSVADDLRGRLKDTKSGAKP